MKMLQFTTSEPALIRKYDNFRPSHLATCPPKKLPIVAPTPHQNCAVPLNSCPSRSLKESDQGKSHFPAPHAPSSGTVPSAMPSSVRPSKGGRNTAAFGTASPLV